MSVVGIDLAAGARKTYACVLTERDATLSAELFAACDDERLLELAKRSDRVAVDAPFGWPREFVDALNAHRRFEAWPAPDDGAPETFRAALSFRATDRVVMQTRRPLSVSTDKLGITAMRCVHLLHRWTVATGETVDRTGGGRFVEVYPAGALKRWGLESSRYKGRNREALRGLVERVLTALPDLRLTGNDRATCTTVDDAFDALVAALVARAAQLGLTDGPPAERREQAAEEGWIHLPLRGSLGLLARPCGALAAAPQEAPARRLRETGASLAANVFAPWLVSAAPVPFAGDAFAGRVRLGVECPTGLRETPPTLDCLVDGDRVLAVESRCTETFAAHEARFAAGYRDASADDRWRDEYERLVEDPRRYRFLDAARLIERYLGLRRRFPDRHVTLAYLYWQPTDAAEVGACTVHAAELAEFSRCVADPRVRFVGMSYDELWREWAAPHQPSWLRAHVAAMRERYDVPASGGR